LKPELPVDVDLVAQGDERKLTRHPKANDVLVCDRGCFSCAMRYCHRARGRHPVFRLKAGTCSVIDPFTARDENDNIIALYPSEKRPEERQKDYPEMKIRPLTLRLLKDTVAGERAISGTT
jgi:hypothetical protein